MRTAAVYLVGASPGRVPSRCQARVITRQPPDNSEVAEGGGLAAPVAEVAVDAQGQACPDDAFDLLVQILARICDDPYDRLFSLPTGKDPRERMGELGDSGFIVFTVDDDADLVRVYGLVWIG